MNNTQTQYLFDASNNGNKMTDTEKEWYKELWEEFKNINILQESGDNCEDETDEEFFIWPECTDITEILEWFEDKTSGEYPPKGFKRSDLKMRNNDICEECEYPRDECECDRCSECERYECVCECEHESIDDSGYCNRCEYFYREDCDHDEVNSSGICTDCHLDIRSYCNHDNVHRTTHECTRCGLFIEEYEEEEDEEEPLQYCEHNVRINQIGTNNCIECANLNTIRCRNCNAITATQLNPQILFAHSGEERCYRCHQIEIEQQPGTQEYYQRNDGTESFHAR